MPNTEQIHDRRMDAEDAAWDAWVDCLPDMEKAFYAGVRAYKGALTCSLSEAEQMVEEMIPKWQGTVLRRKLRVAQYKIQQVRGVIKMLRGRQENKLDCPFRMTATSLEEALLLPDDVENF